jgi:hypothetical protein
MSVALDLALCHEPGLLRASATLAEPLVSLDAWDRQQPVLVIEEGGVSVELEFTCVEAFLGFQQRIANLQLPGEQRA